MLVLDCKHMLQELGGTGLKRFCPKIAKLCREHRNVADEVWEGPAKISEWGSKLCPLWRDKQFPSSCPVVVFNSQTWPGRCHSMANNIPLHLDVPVRGQTLPLPLRLLMLLPCRSPILGPNWSECVSHGCYFQHLLAVIQPSVSSCPGADWRGPSAGLYGLWGQYRPLTCSWGSDTLAQPLTVPRMTSWLLLRWQRVPHPLADKLGLV